MPSFRSSTKLPDDIILDKSKLKTFGEDKIRYDSKNENCP